MDLSITFTGMCLFVPEARGRLKVLLPQHNHGAPSDRHNAQIRFSGWQGWESLDNCELAVLGHEAGGSAGKLPKNVLNLTDLLTQKVACEQTMPGGLGRDLAARIILPLPHRYGANEKPVKFRVERPNGSAGQTQELVHRITYHLNDVRDFGQVWNVSQLGFPLRKEALFKPPAGQDISLEIRNVPRWDPPAKKDCPVRHFHGYFHMFPNRPDPAPEVILDEEPDGNAKKILALTAYTCMLGQGDHDP